MFQECKPFPALEAMAWKEAWRCAPHPGVEPLANRLILDFERPEAGHWQVYFHWAVVGEREGLEIIGPCSPRWFQRVEEAPSS